MDGSSMWHPSFVEIRKKAIYAVEEVLKKRHGYKVSIIANPENGKEFFEKLFKVEWSSDHQLSIEKLKVLASSKISCERYYTHTLSSSIY